MANPPKVPPSSQLAVQFFQTHMHEGTSVVVPKHVQADLRYAVKTRNADLFVASVRTLSNYRPSDILDYIPVDTFISRPLFQQIKEEAKALGAAFGQDAVPDIPWDVLSTEAQAKHQVLSVTEQWALCRELADQLPSACPTDQATLMAMRTQMIAFLASKHVDISDQEYTSIIRSTVTLKYALSPEAVTRLAMNDPKRYSPAQQHIDHANAYMLRDQARSLEFAETAYAHADPAQAAAIGSDVLLRRHNTATDGVQLRDHHVQWAERHTRDIPKMSHSEGHPDPDKKLRIGFVGNGLTTGVAGQFLDGFLRHFNSDHYEVTLFLPEHLRHATAAARQRFTYVYLPTDDSAAAQIIHDQRIDIAIDLDGHTPGNRLLALAHQPAPVQATYLGYPNTTGMAGTIGYRITDEHADPPGAERFCTEKLVRLPHVFLNYSRAYHARGDTAESLANPDPPVLRNGYVTFGVFNNPKKITEERVAMWAEILKQTPGAKICFKYLYLEEDILIQHTLLTWFKKYGIADADQRIQFLSEPSVNPGSKINHLRAFNDVDISLDTYPYHGTITTCDSLSMGVPVVCQVGPELHVSRVGGSLLHAVQLDDELVATDAPGYIAKAVALAHNPTRIAELRRTLPAALDASPLGDSAAFTRHFERALRGMWTDHCASAS